MCSEHIKRTRSAKKHFTIDSAIDFIRCLLLDTLTDICLSTYLVCPSRVGCLWNWGDCLVAAWGQWRWSTTVCGPWSTTSSQGGPWSGPLSPEIHQKQVNIDIMLLLGFWSGCVLWSGPLSPEIHQKQVNINIYWCCWDSSQGEPWSGPPSPEIHQKQVNTDIMLLLGFHSSSIHSKSYVTRAQWICLRMENRAI